MNHIRDSTSFRRKQRAANDWRISLAGTCILLLACTVQRTHQSNQQNVPFKTSFVSSSDYLPIRRNGALISLPFANLEQNHRSPEQLVISASSYEPVAEEDMIGRELHFTSQRNNQQQSGADQAPADQQVLQAASRRQSSETGVEDLVALSSGETNTSFLDVTLAQANGSAPTESKQQINPSATTTTTTTTTQAPTTTTIVNQPVPTATTTTPSPPTTVASNVTSTAPALAQTTSTQAATTTNQLSATTTTTTVVPTTSHPSTDAPTTLASSTTNPPAPEKTTAKVAEEATIGAHVVQTSTQQVEQASTTTAASSSVASQETTTAVTNKENARELAGRSQSLPCNFGEPNCRYTVATIPVLETSKTGNGTRLVNEFVFVPEDPEITLEDSNYSTKKPGAKDVETATLVAEHRTLEGDGNSGDDLELDYVTSDQEESHSERAGLDANGSAPQTTAPATTKTTTAGTTTTTGVPQVLINRRGESPSTGLVADDLSRIMSATGTRLTQSTADAAMMLRNNATRSSQSTSFTIRVISPNQQTIRINQTQSPASTIKPLPTTTTNVDTAPVVTSTTTTAPIPSTMTTAPVTLKSTTTTTTAAPVPTTRRAIHGARLNQKILRISDGVQTGAKQVAQTTTTTTTVRPTLTNSYRRPKQSHNSEHRQFFSEPAGADIRRRLPSGRTKQTLQQSEDEEASILARYTVASQLTRLSASGSDRREGTTGRRAVWSSSRAQVASRVVPQTSIFQSDSALTETRAVPTTTEAPIKTTSTSTTTTTSTTTSTTPAPTTTAAPSTTPPTTTTSTGKPMVWRSESLNESVLAANLPIANLSAQSVPATTVTNAENKRSKPVPIPQQLLKTHAQPQPLPQPQPQLIMGAESSAALVAQLIGQRLADEVMTLIADTAATAERGSPSASTLVEPILPRITLQTAASTTRSHPAVIQQTDERHLIENRASTTTAVPNEAGFNLLESKVRRLVDEVDEYEGSIEDQLAKDALHYQGNAAAGKLTKDRQANKSTGSMSRQQVNAAVVDSGKWQADSDADYAPSSAVSSTSTNQDENSNQANLLPGRPGIDYPTHWQVPKTSFDCRNYEQSGFYADVESDCQAYHSCHKGRGGRHSFLCPNGTLFSQELLTCSWWYDVECSASKLHLTNENSVNNNNLDSERATSARNEEASSDAKVGGGASNQGREV